VISILSMKEASASIALTEASNLVERFTGLTRRDKSSTVPSPSRNPSPPVGALERFDRNSNFIVAAFGASLIQAACRAWCSMPSLAETRRDAKQRAAYHCTLALIGVGAAAAMIFLNRDKSEGGSTGYPMISVPTGTYEEMASLVPYQTGKGR